MVGRLVSFWDGLFSGAMLVSGRVKGTSSSKLPFGGFHFESSRVVPLVFHCPPLKLEVECGKKKHQTVWVKNHKLHLKLWWISEDVSERREPKSYRKMYHFPFLNPFPIHASWGNISAYSVIIQDCATLKFRIGNPKMTRKRRFFRKNHANWESFSIFFGCYKKKHHSHEKLRVTWNGYGFKPVSFQMRRSKVEDY